MPISRLDGNKELNLRNALLRLQKYSCLALLTIFNDLLPLPFLASHVTLLSFVSFLSTAFGSLYSSASSSS